MQIPKILTLTILSLFAFAACNQAQEEEVIEILTEDAEVMETTDGGEDTTGDPEEEEVEELTEASAGGTYVAYSEENLTSALASGPVALFFHAEWCPTCVGMEADIKENLASFPDGTTIVVANFDDETALRQKYGITTQSVIVIVDGEGNEVKKLAAPGSDEIIKQLKMAI